MAVQEEAYLRSHPTVRSSFGCHDSSLSLHSGNPKISNLNNLVYHKMRILQILFATITTHYCQSFCIHGLAKYFVTLQKVALWKWTVILMIWSERMVTQMVILVKLRDQTWKLEWLTINHCHLMRWHFKNEKRIYFNSIIIVKNFLFFNLAHFNRQSPATYLLHFHPLEDLQSWGPGG